MNKIFLSVVIPAYNESKRIPRTLLAVDHYLQSPEFEELLSENEFQPDSYEILVVDDGSTDKTTEVVEKLQGLIKNLRVIDNKENHGKGWVVRQGMLEAQGRFRLFTDADNSTSIKQVEKLLPFMKGVTYSKREKESSESFHIAIGSRAVKGSIIKTPQSPHRVLLGKMANLLIQVVAVPGIWDTQCGFKLLTGRAAREIFSRALINRWGFDIEVLALGRKLGFSVKEVPVVWVNDPDSKVTFVGYLNTFRELFKVRINFLTNKYQINK